LALVRARVDRALLLTYLGIPGELDDAKRTLGIARELADPALVARALTACGVIGAADDADLAQQHLTEAAGIARNLGDSWMLGQIRALETVSALIVGDLTRGVAAAEEGVRIADGIGDGFASRQCRVALSWGQIFRGDLHGADALLGEVIEECNAAHDPMYAMYASLMRSFVLAYLGDAAGARAAADAVLQIAAERLEYRHGVAYVASGMAHLATGDASAAWEAFEAARQHSAMDPQTGSTFNWAALAPLACGDLDAARRWADDVVSVARGCFLPLSLTSRARVEIARGELDAAERDAYEALDQAARLAGDVVAPFALDCLAMVAADEDTHVSAARLFGAAEAARKRMGLVRFKVLDADDAARVAALRDAMGQADFDAAWAEGAALSLAEAIAYAQRRRGERSRAGSGWASLTRAELDVVKLVSEGLGNKDVAARLFVSPRTVQAHLTHIYTKLGLSSRVQLAQEAARHG
jgi:DNA-binding CsgD family transcriptional regulator